MMIKRSSSASDINLEVPNLPRTSQSFIPVITPRRSQSSLTTPPLSSSSTSSLHLGLVPPSRHLSVSGSPSHRAPGPSPPPATAPTTPFRSFRNLLSFGPSKPSPATNTIGVPKSSFSGFASLRRSIHGDRNVSASETRHEHSPDDSPVLTIDLPHPGFGPLIHELKSKASDPPVSSTSSVKTEAQGSFEPQLVLSDLSTILESDISGISKHLPTVDDSDRSCTSLSPIDVSLLHTGRAQRGSNKSSHSPFSLSTLPLELSSSKVTSEVLEALSVTNRKGGWLHGVVVDDDEAGGLPKASLLPEAHDSLNLSAFDPDLAALLSPNRLTSREPDLIGMGALPTLALTPSGPPSTLLPAVQLQREPLERTRSAHAAPASPPLASPTHSSPVRRPSALLCNGSSNTPASALPRLIRSASDRPSSPRDAPSRTARAVSISPERPAHPPPPEEQAPSTSRAPLRRPHAGDFALRKPALTRLVTPARPSSARTPARLATSTWELASVPLSRPASSAGTTSHLQFPLPSLDIERQRPTRLRTRERSSSVAERTRSPDAPSQSSLQTLRAADSLGPRTAKVFAAAGLLDADKNGSGRLPPAHFGTARSSIEHDSRARYAPSRLALSEVGSGAPWSRRRSGSLTQIAESSLMLSSPFSESVSTPRTAFSGASTAPTSVSVSNSASAALQLLQEKHALETGALLSALADSQRTTRVLREENHGLRERVADLEAHLANVVEELRWLQYTLPHPAFSALSGQQRYDEGKATGTALSDRVQARLQVFRQKYDASFEQPPSSELQPELAVIPSRRSHSRSPGTPRDVHTLADSLSADRKRMSSCSSLFPGPPSNMSLIMQEDDLMDNEHSADLDHSRPASPTLVLAQLGGKYSHGPRSPSLESEENVSPTTANFSMVTGSPGSLYLRPEHEKLLGEMPSLDLCSEVVPSEYGGS